MRVSREQMQANRLRILDCAGRLFREKGFEAVSVAEVMQAAGLTHGGFYGHFTSKDDLIAQAVAHIFSAGPSSRGGLGAYLDAYLAPDHRDGVGEGCPTAALVADVRRQTPAARAAMSEGFRSQIDRMEAAMGGAGALRRQAVGAWAAMVGAIVLARATEDQDLSAEILELTRAWIGDKLAEEPTA